MENSQIAQVFATIADLLELKEGNQFRIRSYRNASRTVSDLSERIADMVEEGKDLSDLPNIGKSTADKIREILQTGTCQRLEELKDEVPAQLAELMRIPELGPRKVKQLNDQLGVETVADLKQACEEHRVRDLDGMGAKTEENILKGIKIQQSSSERTMLKQAAEQVEATARILDGREEISKWEVAGSFRRRRETVGDLDILVQSEDRQATSDALVDSDIVNDVIGRGKEKLSIRLGTGLQVDFRYFEEDSFGAALMYFTGSQAHNIAVRQRAVDQGWKLNEYGLFEDDKLLAGESEEELYKKLSLPWIPPELREDRGEIQAAEKGELPELVELDDIQGDLHCHTNVTDGKNTIREMAGAAQEMGYKYMAICDHSQAVRVAGGLAEDALKKHADNIREVNEDLDRFWLMAGVEVDILRDGSLDIDENVLADLDWVTASIHYNFNLNDKEMTDRILAAVRSGVVSCLGHPFARQFGKRDPMQLNFDKILEACRDNSVRLEINSQPERLDLPDIYCKRARDAGVKVVIDTDAHSTDELAFMRFGVGIARRGWLEKSDVLNTRNLTELRKEL